VLEYLDAKHGPVNEADRQWAAAAFDEAEGIEPANRSA
jgi:hypothetical protein